jgi:hypothetical protein
MTGAIAGSYLCSGLKARAAKAIVATDNVKATINAASIMCCPRTALARERKGRKLVSATRWQGKSLAHEYVSGPRKPKTMATATCETFAAVLQLKKKSRQVFPSTYVPGGLKGNHATTTALYVHRPGSDSKGVGSDSFALPAPMGSALKRGQTEYGCRGFMGAGCTIARNGASRPWRRK